MGLSEDGLDAWEGPSQSEVAKDVAVDVSAVDLISTARGGLFLR